MHAAPESFSREPSVESGTSQSQESAEDRVLLVVDSDRQLRDAMVRSLSAPGLRVLSRTADDEAERILREMRVDFVIAAGAAGVELLTLARTLQPRAGRAFACDSSDMCTLREAVNRAAVTQLIGRPIASQDAERIREALRELPAAELGALPRATTASPGARFGLIGNSAPIRALVEMIERIGPTDSTVLVTGETGTGKELVGGAIHACSARRNRIFSAINSAALPETLLESELFGHRRGAFTGAAANRQGLFEHADGGTVFLDELGEMPLTMQAKLLRFLQTGEIRPLGGEASRHVDVRLVSATNKDLEEEVRGGRFREDLFYRLAVIPVTVPALRDRIDDLPLLVDHFLNPQAGAPRAEIEDDALGALAAYRWPGNVRELQNVIERGVALCRDGRIRVQDLPARVLAPERGGELDSIQSLPGLERKHILETLDRVGWNRKQAASLLQISTTTLWRRLKEFGIDEGARSARAASRG